ncbi:MAG: hypothetical protein ACMXYC_01265 [Candidatus Woesearchaeota archaeon]
MRVVVIVVSVLYLFLVGCAPCASYENVLYMYIDGHRYAEFVDDVFFERTIAIEQRYEHCASSHTYRIYTNASILDLGKRVSARQFNDFVMSYNESCDGCVHVRALFDQAVS